MKTVQELSTHAHQLADAFNVVLDEDKTRDWRTSCADPRTRRAFLSTITDHRTYAIALHEMGHLSAPSGYLPSYALAQPFTETPEWARFFALKLEEETAAWEWAKHYALVWTEEMEAMYRYALGGYQQQFTAAVFREVK